MVNESLRVDSLEPTTPGTRRATASTRTIAAASSSIEDIVADADLVRGEVLADSLVEPFVASTDENEVVFASELLDKGLCEAFALGRQQDNRSVFPACHVSRGWTPLPRTGDQVSSTCRGRPRRCNRLWSGGGRA